MPNRSQGRKKSEFPANTSIPGGSTLDFVSGGVNYKITLSDFQNALNVTGSIVQDGAVTGVPILDTQGAVNNIRNIEPGNGIKASISPENGAIIEHNFQQQATGVQIVDNFSQASPKFASFAEGDGIDITKSGDIITISATGELPSTTTVVVNELSDFPAPVANVITLAEDTLYFLNNKINVGTVRFIFSNNTSLTGASNLTTGITYTGTGDLFTMSNVTATVQGMELDLINGRLFNWNNTTAKVLRAVDIRILNCDKIGLMNSTSGGIIRCTNFSPSNVVTDGFEFTGNWRAFSNQVTSAAINGGAYHNLGTALFDGFVIDGSIVDLAGGTNLVSGLAGSANINAGGSGNVINQSTKGAGTPLSGISVTDSLWTFRGNDDIADTRPDGLLSMQGNSTDTVITAAGTPVLIAGTWGVDSSSQFTGDAAGRLTYNGGKNAILPIDAPITLEPSTGGSTKLSAEVAINGSAVPNSKLSITTSSGAPLTIPLTWQVTFSTNDYVEIFVTNENNTNNIIVSSAILRVN